MNARFLYETQFGRTALGGLCIILLYCVLATGADAITRTFAEGFEAPQLFCFSGGLVTLFSIATLMFGATQTSLRPQKPFPLAIRSAFFICSSVFYFLAFRSLPFAEVFVFIALVPVFAALLSGPILGEQVQLKSWIALAAGACGMLLLYPSGLEELTLAHLWAGSAAVCGAVSMVLARYISRAEKNALLQVLYPNLALCLVMAFVLPAVYRPMGMTEIALIVSYAVLLFLARWVLIIALTRMKAYVASLLINLQFVVMIAVGAILFGEIPSLTLVLGAFVIILAGAYLLFAPAVRGPEPAMKPVG